MGSAWAAALAVVLSLAGAVAVYAAQPTPKPHGKPTPTPSLRVTPSPPAAKPTPSPSKSPTPAASPESPKSTETPGAHPCNHGWYVSQAAQHAGSAGGAYVSSVARSNLGKDKTCTAPLPPPPSG